MTRTWIAAQLAAAAGSAIFSTLLLAQQPTAGPGGPAAAGFLTGTVVDSRTSEPVAVAQVRLREMGRSELSHSDGAFHFDQIPAGSYTLLVERIGYAPAQQTVRVEEGQTSRVTIALVPSVIDLVGLVVTGTGSERGAGESYRPTNSIGGAELRRKLASSIAATLAGEPGIAQRYNGPAAAQPVIRGLSGDRVLVLEDGQRTGDLASTSADHAVSIEALTAERIEVVRGPAGLLYGSNALGGVINVIREEVPRTVPDRVTGLATGQLESVNRGMTGGLALTAPLGPLAVRGEISGRTAGDTRTPPGPLPTTSLDGYNAGAGASWVGPRGYIGASARDYSLRYGVPGTFNGEVIPGAHEGGVEVDMRRTTARLEAVMLRGIGPFESVELDGSYVRFDQDELELGGPGGPVIGTEFRQFIRTGELIARHDHATEGVRLRGAAGIWGLDKNFSTAGSRTGSVPADQLALAGFLFEEFGLSPFHVEVGGRYDWTRITPLEEGMREIGFVRAREFGAVSGSLSALVDLWSGWSAGASLSRAFRTPAIEELFSNGPHLANYSFNVGNPELEPEYGVGTDLFIRAALPRFNGELSVYRNAISNYIHHAPTGELDPQRGEIPVYQATQDDALLSGFEGRAQLEFLPGWVADGSASYVRGTRKSAEGEEPLPEIPPLGGSFGVRHDASQYFAGASWEGAAAQDRVPSPDPDAEIISPFDQPTAGYGLLNAVGGYRWSARGQLHTLTLRVSNLFDSEWRDHLSRVKTVAPQPGRNIQLLYRVDF